MSSKKVVASFVLRSVAAFYYLSLFLLLLLLLLLLLFCGDIGTYWITTSTHPSLSSSSSSIHVIAFVVIPTQQYNHYRERVIHPTTSALIYLSTSSSLISKLLQQERYYCIRNHYPDSTATTKTKLQLQFQAGNSKMEDDDHDDDNNDNNNKELSVPPSSTDINNATSTTTTTTQPTHLFATITSTNNAIQESMLQPPVVRNTKSTITIVQTSFHQTVYDLQQIYGIESISIVYDDEIDDSNDIIDNEDSFGTTLIPINSLIFEVVDDNQKSSPLISTSTTAILPYIVVIIASDRRVNVTALQDVLTRELLLEGNHTPQSTIKVQLAPRDKVVHWCGFPPGTVPPILSSCLRTDSSDRIPPTTKDIVVVDEPWNDIRPPTLTIIDEALVAKSSRSSGSSMSLVSGGIDDVYFIGGGGQPNYSCRVTLDVLVQQPDTIIGNISTTTTTIRSEPPFPRATSKGSNNCDENAASIPNALIAYSIDPSQPRTVPYFSIAGPYDTYEAELLLGKLNNDDTDSFINRPTKNEPIVVQDGWDAVWEYQKVPKFDTQETVTFVGRIGKVRRMARELSFCDLLPPDLDINTFNDDNEYDTNDDVVGIDLVFPWRNPVTDSKMAVQLICGKTLCQNSGSDNAIRQLHPGQLVLVQGRTNLQSKNSLRNWIYNQTLDIVVLSYVLLLPVPIVEKSGRGASTARQRIAGPRKLPSNNPTSFIAENCLRLHELYDTAANEVGIVDTTATEDADSITLLDLAVNGDHKINGESISTTISSHVIVVDDFQSVKRFTKDLSQLLQSYTMTKQNTIADPSSSRTSIGLVGIDCEWKPNFYMDSSREPQPVLVLQISLNPLKQVYLFDLQTLLRPMMPQSQPMDKLETDVSFALQALFESKRLIKVGFHVVNDLRQLAASYPHIPALQFYNAVIEASTLGKKSIRRTQSGNAREATSSLSRLVNHFIGKPLNKQEQCSDWSKRPFTAEQIEYAALDAAVTPIMVEKMINDLEAHFFGDKPYLGRWESDMSFKTAISSLRFVFIHTIDPNVQRKLKAKQVVGDPMIVSQSWITGDVPPKLPMIPESDSDGVYTDVHGIIQIPSVSVFIRSNHIVDVLDSMIGKKVGTSKDMCVSKFLHRPTSFPDGARLEYPQRSGFVEFKDGVVLFVNMQSASGNRFKSKSYPNEWLLDGKILTWFLRENDWRRGETPLAKKLLADPNAVLVTLFVRMGRAGEFVCCGRCRVEDIPNEINGYRSLPETPDSWTLIKLNLNLLDWKKLQSSANFQSLLSPSVDSNSDADNSVFE